MISIIAVNPSYGPESSSEANITILILFRDMVVDNLCINYLIIHQK